MNFLLGLQTKIATIDWGSSTTATIVAIVGIIAGIIIPLVLKEIKVRKDTLKQYFKNGKWKKATKIECTDVDDQRPKTEYLHNDKLEFEIVTAIKNKKHIILLGPSLRGKTRLMVEVLRQIKSAYILLAQPSNFPNKILFPRLYLRAKYKIIVFNDLQLFYDSHNNASTLFDAAHTNKFIIFANCRTAHEWKTLSSIIGASRLSILQEIKIPEPENDFVAEAARINNKSVLPKCKNVGELFVNSDDMLIKYQTKLSPTEQQILIGIKELYLVGKKNNDGIILLHDIKLICSQRQLTLLDQEWINSIKNIIDLDFCKGTHDKIKPERIYLERIVEPNLSIKEVIQDCISAFPDNQIQYARILNRINNFEELSKTVKNIKDVGGKFDIHCYNCLIARSSYYESKRLLDEMDENNISPNVVTFSILMDKCKNFEQGKEVLQLMAKEEPKIPPDVITFNILMKKCINFEQVKEVLQLMAMAKPKISPNVVTFSTLMNMCNNFEQGKEVLWLMAMEKPKIAPDVITFGTLLNKCNNFGEGKEVLQLMAMEEPRISPNVVIFSTFMNKCNNFKQGKEVLRMMAIEKPMVTPNVVTFNTLMNKCNNFGEGKEVLRLMAKEEPKIVPDVVTFGTLLKKCNNFGEGKKVLQLMAMEEPKVSPDAIAFSTLLDKCKKPEELIAWVNIFCLSGITPNTRTVSTLQQLTKLFYNRLSPDGRDKILNLF